MARRNVLQEVAQLCALLVARQIVRGEVVLRIVLHSPQVVPMLLSPAPLQGQGCGDELAVLGEGEAGHLVDLVVG